MLRRVATLMRRLLFVVGLASLAWLPISFFTEAWLFAVGQNSWVFDVQVYSGTLQVLFMPGPELPEVGYGIAGARERPSPPLWPTTFHAYRSDGVYEGRLVFLPLWLPALLCLAWPVTSFLLGRRRRGARGFEVQAGPAPPPPTGGR